MQAPNKLQEILILEAKQWLGTPYMENSSVKGHGADCAGFLIGVFKNCGISYNFREIGLEQSLKLFFKTSKNLKCGDILIFKSTDNELKHLGILTEEAKFIHAHWNAGIVENTFGNWFKSRLIAAYEFVG